jgi:hypothetical protein
MWESVPYHIYAKGRARIVAEIVERGGSGEVGGTE